MSAAADEVVLCLPARLEYGRIARIGAASLGLRLQMPFGTIDDLRRVVDETFSLLLDGDETPDRPHSPETANGAVPGEPDACGGPERPPDDGAGAIEMVFRAEEDALELQAGRSRPGPLSEAAVHRFDALVSGLVDDCDIDAAGASLRVRRSVKDRD